MKCSDCKYGKPIVVQRHGVGASSYLGTFCREEYKCKHTENKKWYKTFHGKTRPKSCPLKKESEK